MKRLITIGIFLMSFAASAASQGQFVQQRYPASKVVISGANGQELKGLVKSFEKSFAIKLKLEKQKVKGSATQYNTSRVISADEQQDWERLASESGAEVFFPILEDRSESKRMKKMQRLSNTKSEK